MAKTYKSCSIRNRPMQDGICQGVDVRCANCRNFIDFMPDTVYIVTTQDRFELPIFVADDYQELERVTGDSAAKIQHMISNTKVKMLRTKYKYMKVNIGDA